MHLAITNHTGARNRGAEALVRCMADGFRRYYPELAVALYSSDPLYDQWRFQHDVTAYWGYPLLTPNHARAMAVNRLAYRAAYWAEFALPATLRGSCLRVQRDLRQAAVSVAAGGDIFTSDYHNLRKHLAYPLMARGTPMYLCSHSIGPFTPADRDYFCRAAEKIDLITVREDDSFAYLRSLDVQTRVEPTADVAFTLAVPDKANSKSWLAKRYGFDDSIPCVGLSISQGIIQYSGLDADAYYQCFAEVCDALLTAGKQIMLIPHVMERHPANNDVIACDEVLKRISANGRVTVLSGEPGAVALKGAIGQCEALIGTRTHATIASMSQGIPTVSVAYSRKAFGIMKDVYGHTDGPALTVAAEQLSPKALLHALEKAMATPINASHLAEIKQRAERNFTLLSTLL
ncbi:polysaccharide pyruvyl transferase family protein [Vreelandella massiliensis]|uniref:polysaccharide pyruvyl transferase family protein n=1 Tax=Vreelandella massiliensis TaxID=1816686 RepID=UPI00096A94BD|nr:polysaccharide pyruvyl transferase family protein [Halomonas massiliensis]